MARRIFSFDPPDRFVAAAIGEPGHRAFFLQARLGGALVTVALEKVQVAVLAERLSVLLDEIATRGVEVPEAVSPFSRDKAPLDEPIVEQFRVGAMALAWEGEDDAVVIEAQAEVDESDEAIVAVVDGDDGPDLLRVRLSPGSARAFAERALEEVAAGRPPCPLCGQPLDPEGHICPRRNGYVH